MQSILWTIAGHCGQEPQNTVLRVTATVLLKRLEKCVAGTFQGIYALFVPTGGQVGFVLEAAERRALYLDLCSCVCTVMARGPSCV